MSVHIKIAKGQQSNAYDILYNRLGIHTKVAVFNNNCT